MNTPPVPQHILDNVSLEIRHLSDVLAVSCHAMNKMSEHNKDQRNIGTEVLEDLTRVIVRAIAEKGEQECNHKNLSLISLRSPELDTSIFMLAYTPRSVASNIEAGDLFYAFAKNSEIRENRSRSN